MGMGLTTANVERRALYTYVSASKYDAVLGGALTTESVQRRALYTYVNESKHGLAGQRVLNANDVTRRVLYLVVNIVHDRDPTDVAARALHPYAAYDSTELFPWIEKIEPVEQGRGGQVSVYGDGFGATEAAEGGIVRLGVYDPTQLGPGAVMGVVSWSSRSANLHPANSGLPTEPALVVTVPVDGDSGMLSVEETT